MNRRGFLSSILQAGVAAMVLPSALTYARTWKRVEIGGPLYIPIPEFEKYKFDYLPFDPKLWRGKWEFISKDSETLCFEDPAIPLSIPAVS